MERFDVAIVGGGPAGSSAAHAAASAGASAVVLEKGVPRADRPDRLGPDSTDAAGILDYWVDIMGIHPDEMPDDVVLGTLDRAEFIGPNESLTLRSTGIESSYDNFGFCMHRARFDDFLRDRAEAAGATYRVGTAVRDVETDLGVDPVAGSTPGSAPGNSPRHRLSLADGETVGADFLVLADGPQRQVTNRVLDDYLPFDVTERLSTRETNHIAYQEHRRLPDEVFEAVEGAIKFWWGHMPGHTAYPWIFPNDDNVARIGLTMPIGMELDDVANRDDYPLLRPDDERIPQGREYLQRLLEQEYGDEYDVETDFPLVEDRGKSGGTETYAISSTRPIDSPTAAGIAVVGGAMGATSAFHEGGDHTAVRTGAIAGELAAAGDLAPYNDRWKDAIGEEVLRNVAMADVVHDYEPNDWDWAFSTARKLMDRSEGYGLLDTSNVRASFSAARLVTSYKRAKFSLRNGKYVQLSESEFTV
jgi:electron-transferring-flavoprotein dehydrogenase